MSTANDASPEIKIIATCMVVVTAIASGFTLAYLKPVLAPFTLAVLFVLALNPFVDLLENRAKLPHPVAVGVTLLVAALLLVGTGGIISATVANLANNADVYQEQIARQVTAAQAWAPRFDALAEVDTEDAKKAMLEGPLAALNGIFTGFVGGMFNLLSNGFLILIFTLFLLLGQAVRSGPSDGVRGEALKSIQSYLLLKTAISVGTGLLHGIILWTLGVKFPFVFGMLAALLNFIPNFGPVIAVIAPAPLFPLSPEITLLTGTLALVLPAALHFASGNLVEPRLIGASLDLSPVAVLLSLIFFGMIWGVIGMFLATPLTAALKIALQQNEYTAPAAALLAGRVDEAFGGGGKS